jgi:hypothetical protein
MKFIADNMLGRLAKWLRIIGCDVLYFQDIEDEELIRISLKENRIVLTRDTKLIKRLKNYLFIKNDHIKDQLSQFLDAFRIDPFENFFKRCTVCNDLIKEIKKDEIKKFIPPYVYNTQSIFMRCPGCKRIYWGGTHKRRAEDRLKEFLNK